MSYNPVTDFIALLRQTANGMRSERMPGLDYVVAALARAGIVNLSVGQLPPTSNQVNTVWVKPSLPNSTLAECTVYVYNTSAAVYQLATPALWAALFAAGYATVFQAIVAGAGTIADETTLLAVERANPATTALALPSVLNRVNKTLRIADWSTAVVNHAITLTPNGAETIMRLPSFQMLSTVDQLAGITLYPSIDLNGWVITP